MQLLKLFVGHPHPTDNFIWFTCLLFILFIILFIKQIKNVNQVKLLPSIIAIPMLTTFLSFIGVAYGTALALDAIANVPAAQRSQAMSTGISVSVGTLMIPSIFTSFEIVLLVIFFTIKYWIVDNKKNVDGNRTWA